MSNPAVQKVTAAVSQRMRGSSVPAMAIHAAAGAIPSENPSTKWESEVKRFVKEYERTTASATGDKARQSGFSIQAAMPSTAEEAMTKPHANAGLRTPAGMWRLLVRGFRASILAS